MITEQPDFSVKDIHEQNLYFWPCARNMTLRVTSYRISPCALVAGWGLPAQLVVRSPVQLWHSDL